MTALSESTDQVVERSLVACDSGGIGRYRKQRLMPGEIACGSQAGASNTSHDRTPGLAYGAAHLL